MLLLALPAVAHAAPARGPVVVPDAAGDVPAGALDLARISVGRSPDGRLRVSVTMTSPWSPRDLLARGGEPPGTICLRTWLGGKKPTGAPPDYLVCATVGADNDTLKASVLRERNGDLPERVADASAVKVSARTAVLRFQQSALGRPAALRFGVEARAAACRRLDCVDTAPDAPRSARLALR
jgi:hypothetical protein